MAGADLAQLLFKHSLTVVLLLLVLRLLYHTSASRRVFAARCGLVALLLMPLVWLSIPPLQLRMPLALSALLDPPLVIPATVTTAVVPSVDAALALPARAASLGRLLLGVYLLGLLCHLLRLALNVHRLQQADHAAQPCAAPAWNAALQQLRGTLALRRPVCLLVSNAATSPYSWGWWRPVIVLDRHSATHADPAAVLAHELAHIRAHDWPMLLLARTLLGLYWWHPLMYPLLRTLEHDTECAADDAVLAAGATPSHYAHTLISVSRQAAGPASAASAVSAASVAPAALANRIASRGAMLVARVAALLEAHRPRGRVTARQWWSGALATVALLGAFGSLRLQGEHVLWPHQLLPAAGNSTSASGDPVALLASLDNPNFRQLAVAMRAGDFSLRHADYKEDIASFRQRAAIPPLLLALRDAQPVVRQLALWGLSEMRFAETAPAIAAMLADPDAAVRAEAAGALGDLGETRWLAAMIAMLGDPHPVVRARAAHALGDLQAHAAIPRLTQQRDDPVAAVADEVNWALEEMR